MLYKQLFWLPPLWGRWKASSWLRCIWYLQTLTHFVFSQAFWYSTALQLLRCVSLSPLWEGQHCSNCFCCFFYLFWVSLPVWTSLWSPPVLVWSVLGLVLLAQPCCSCELMTVHSHTDNNGGILERSLQSDKSAGWHHGGNRALCQYNI